MYPIQYNTIQDVLPPGIQHSISPDALCETLPKMKQNCVTENTAINLFTTLDPLGFGQE
jgi:hypothetical protein